MGLMLSGFACYICLLSFSTSNDLTVTVWRNKRIIYMLSILSKLADNVQVTKIARMEGKNSATVIIIQYLSCSYHSVLLSLYTVVVPRVCVCS